MSQTPTPVPAPGTVKPAVTTKPLVKPAPAVVVKGPAPAKPGVAATVKPAVAKPPPAPRNTAIPEGLRPHEAELMRTSKPGSTINTRNVEAALKYAQAGNVARGVRICNPQGEQVWPPPERARTTSGPIRPAPQAKPVTKPPAVTGPAIGPQTPAPAKVDPPTVKGGATARPTSKPPAQ